MQNKTIKDVNKVFATKPIERMAGETVASTRNLKDFVAEQKVFDKPFDFSSRPVPGSTIPLGPDDRPLDPSGDSFPITPKIVPGLNDAPVEEWPWGREDDPNYEKKKKELLKRI